MAAIAYGAWASRGLWTVWLNSPLEHYSWIALLIWLIPAYRWSETLSKEQERCVYASIAVTLLGFLASLNSVKYVGLALAFAALVPWTYRSLMWVLFSVSWAPGLGWLMVHFYPNAGAGIHLFVRVLLAFFGASSTWRQRV